MKTIIIVDDSSTARMFTRRCLEIAGCRGSTFIEAENGKEALLNLKDQGADFVVTDLNMPIMDGATLLKWIKASPKLKDIPVVVVTSAGNPAKEQELTDLGAFAVLSKPISPAGLVSAIGVLLENDEESG